MSYQRLAFYDQDSPAQMVQDCLACNTTLGLPQQRQAPPLVSPDLDTANQPAGSLLPVEVSSQAHLVADSLYL